MRSEAHTGQYGRGYQMTAWQSSHRGSIRRPSAVASQNCFTSGRTTGAGAGSTRSWIISGILRSENQRRTRHARTQRATGAMHQHQVAIRHLPLRMGLATHLPPALEHFHHPAHAGMVVAQSAPVGINRQLPPAGAPAPVAHKFPALALLTKAKILERLHDSDRERIVDRGVVDVPR